MLAHTYILCVYFCDSIDYLIEILHKSMHHKILEQIIQ